MVVHGGGGVVVCWMSHALFSLRRHTDFSKLKPSLACKSFDDLPNSDLQK